MSSPCSSGTGLQVTWTMMTCAVYDSVISYVARLLCPTVSPITLPKRNSLPRVALKVVATLSRLVCPPPWNLLSPCRSQIQSPTSPYLSSRPPPPPLREERHRSNGFCEYSFVLRPCDVEVE
jgi:hypothetical protein